MSAQKPEPLDEKAYPVEGTASQLSSVQPTLSKQSDNVDLGNVSNSDTGHIVEGVSWDSAADPNHRLTGDHMGETTTEIRIKELLRRAAEAESAFEQFGTVKDIDNAIEFRSQALSITHEGHAERPKRLFALALSFNDRFQRLGGREDIDKAVDYMAKAAALFPGDHASKPSVLSNLGAFYKLRFGRLDELADLDRAIDCLTQAVGLTLNGHAAKQSSLINLGVSYHSRFERLGDLSDIQKAIDCLTQAVELAPDGHLEKRRPLINLGVSYQSRFQRVGELSDLDEAIKCSREALMLTPDGHAERSLPLNNLGNSYQSRFQRFGQLADIDMAIGWQTQSVQLTHNSSDKAKRLHNLGISYGCRFRRIGELADVDKAIEYHTQAVELTPDNQPDKPSRLNSLGNSYHSRFERLGERADIQKAIGLKIRAVELTPEGHPDKPDWINSLGNSYLCQFKRFGDLTDVEKAVNLQTQAVITADGHAEEPGRLNNLGVSYLSRFECLGELADIDQAIEFLIQAVGLTPADHAEKPHRLNDLGMSYLCRFKRLGKLADIDKAIECKIEAVKLIPDNHPAKSGYLNNLGISYNCRFERLDEVADIQRAIECETRAVLLTPDGHADKSNRLNNLGASYHSRFERFGELADVQKAIEFQTQAVGLTADDHSAKPAQLSNLGTSYLSRFQRFGERFGELADIHTAIEHLAQAVVLLSDDHADRAAQLDNLGRSYQSRFKRLGDPKDIQQAIKCQTQAVALTPDGHADKASLLNNLGHSYRSRFDRLGERTDLEHAQSSWQHGAQLIITMPQWQIRCSRRWAKASSILGLSPQLAYERCFELLPHLIWLGTTVDQRYKLVRKISDLAAEAAAWAISIQAYNIALEWLEAGRSIVWNQILQLRTSLDGLSAVDPILTKKLKDVATQLESIGLGRAATSSPINDLLGPEKLAQHHRLLAIQWEELLEQARSLPGFRNLLRPCTANELVRAARVGPVVIINVHKTRCDALILLPNTGEIAHVPLGTLSVKLAKSTRERLASMIGHQDIRSRGLKLRPIESSYDLSTILETLWSNITKPILDCLGYNRKLPIDELPRVIWCATGPISFLPLHAAGNYDGIQPNVPDLVVSSYAPTLSALLHPESHTSISHSLLAVGQAEYSNGLDDLPCTIDELTEVRKYASQARYMQLDGSSATVDAVLNAMNEHSWVHLACHAIQNRHNASHSGFHLHDGSLTLENITKHSFKGKGFAFLSACQTATGDEKLPDEAVHLAAGMLMAGFPSVIATMWSIRDADGPGVAREVYAELLKDDKIDCKGAARALHKAVACLREKVGQDSFGRWVPFIHIGV